MQNGKEKVFDIIYDASGLPFACVYEGYRYYYVLNQQGDVIQIVGSGGTVCAEYRYDAWGNVLEIGGMYPGTLGAINPIRYRGYYYDAETGFYYLQSRYYDPSIGRFINADALASTGQGFLGYNMFAYCGNDPVNYVDSCGDKSIEVTKEDNNVCINIEGTVNFAAIDFQVVLEIEVGFSLDYEFSVGGIVFTLKNEGVSVELPNGFSGFYKYNSVLEIPENVEGTLELGSGYGLFAGLSNDGFGFGGTYEDDIQSWTLTIRPKIDLISIPPGGGGGIAGGGGGSFGPGAGYSLHNPTLMYCFL